MVTTITVCDTCKREGFDPEAGLEPDGARLAALVEAAAAGSPLVVRRHSCLMGCDFACNVSVQAPGKIAYGIGTFEPELAAAEAIVNWAALHDRSETGQVPYKTWPDGIKGHFRARIFPTEP